MWKDGALLLLYLFARIWLMSHSCMNTAKYRLCLWHPKDVNIAPRLALLLQLAPAVINRSRSWWRCRWNVRKQKKISSSSSHSSNSRISSYIIAVIICRWAEIIAFPCVSTIQYGSIRYRRMAAVLTRDRPVCLSAEQYVPHCQS